jgi:hypothetical protein
MKIFQSKTYYFNYPLFKNFNTNANVLTIPNKKWFFSNNLPSVESFNK